MKRCLILALLFAFSAQNSDASDRTNSGESKPDNDKSYLELPSALETQGSGGGKDFNNDGLADLIWENVADGRRLIWIMHNGLRTSQTIELPTLDPSWHIAAVGDFLGNGQSDLVLENSDGERLIWIFNGGTLQSTIALPTVGGDWHVVGAGDFNGDGKADLVWENTFTGQRLIWLMDNGVRTGATINLGIVSGAWNIAAIADFLGNGQSDIVWEDDGNGEREIWLMNNGVRTGTIDFYATAPWHIAGAADFLGNGQADLIWENRFDGRRQIWIMNKGVRTSTTIDLGVIGTYWHIVDH